MTEQWPEGEEGEEIKMYIRDKDGKIIEVEQIGEVSFGRSEYIPATSPSVAVYGDIKKVFNEEVPCEIPDHDTDEGHDGPGRWYIVSECPHCGASQVDLACSGFVEIMSVNMHLKAPCICGKKSTLLELVQSITRRSV